MTDFLSNNLPNLVGDSRRIKQILVNLVKNSIKFTKKGGITLSVSYDFATSTLKLIVKDTGEGIDK